MVYDLPNVVVGSVLDGEGVEVPLVADLVVPLLDPLGSDVDDADGHEDVVEEQEPDETGHLPQGVAPVVAVEDQVGLVRNGALSWPGLPEQKRRYY